MMFWTTIFIISVAQGLFLITLVWARASKNPVAARLLIALVAIMVLTNFGYLIALTGLLHTIPKLYAVPFGTIYLLGPLLYLYAKALTENAFAFKRAHLFHFMPYLVQFFYMAPFYFLDKSEVIGFIDTFLRGELQIRTAEKVNFVLQDVHLCLYLVLTFRLIKDPSGASANGFIVNMPARMHWVKELVICFSVFVATLIALYVYLSIEGKYVPVTNYIYTLVTSVTIYLIAYRLVLTPELLSPAFNRKYQAYRPFGGEAGQIYKDRITIALEHEKVYRDPELKLTSLAERVDLPSHQLSKLINEQFGKSFSDLVCEYRVNEFITMANDPRYKSLSIYGLALESGFNSKSSFNAAFKRITGRKPSDYRNSKLNDA